MQNLVIVESPAKAKTIKKYLGPSFEVMASYGHVRDLLPKGGAVDIKNNFEMHYALIERNQKHLDAIKKAMKKAGALYLATDPDREGEAIAWHLCEILKEKKSLVNKPVHRVVFHEITKTAIQKAIKEPREVSMNLVNAQQARRALDYLVGFTLSPLLWKKIRRGLSAGRVQSPALRLIVEREQEIEKFETQEYWYVTANSQKDGQAFPAKLISYENKKLEQFSITEDSQAEKVKETLLKSADKKIRVTKVEKKLRKRNPAAPFITSTLQQEAARKLGFTTKRTMMVAQQLYEGIDVGEGATGLITYMRTDSVHLAEEAVSEIRDYIQKNYGKENLPDTPRVFRTKSKNAQEAHEAIRPTSVHCAPEGLQKALNKDQYRLYNLIWQRTLASQMMHATMNTVSVDLTCAGHDIFRATGSTILHPGFIAVYQEGLDEEKKTDDDKNLLPVLKEGDVIDLLNIETSQHFTEPPPRYTEASLVKTLEEHGIGRPSTYSSIISTLQQREYVYLEKKRFYPTDVGRIVSQFLTRYFEKYVDYGFTASLEDELDDIARGEKQWVPVLDVFWHPFIEKIQKIDETVQRKDVTQEKIDEKCPKCAEPLSIRLGRNGRFIGCTAYPECDYTRNLESPDKEEETPELVADRKCPDCDQALIIKQGPYGKFIGCSSYPNCKFIEPLKKPTDTGVECPACHKGTLLQRRSRRGKIFYACKTFPECDYALWNEPVTEACPECAWPIMMIKETKRDGREKVCPRKECGCKLKADEK